MTFYFKYLLLMNHEMFVATEFQRGKEICIAIQRRSLLMFAGHIFIHESLKIDDTGDEASLLEDAIAKRIERQLLYTDTNPSFEQMHAVPAYRDAVRSDMAQAPKVTLSSP